MRLFLLPIALLFGSALNAQPVLDAPAEPNVGFGENGPLITPTRPVPLGLPEFDGLLFAPRLQPGDTLYVDGQTYASGIEYLLPFLEVDHDFYQNIVTAGGQYGAREFLDHHRAALRRLQTQLVAFGEGEFPARPLMEMFYFQELLNLLPVGFISLGPRPLTPDELREAFAVRLFDDLPPPPPAGFGQLSLDHAFTALPNGNAINVPFGNDEEAFTAPYRRVTFTATETTDIPLSHMRFVIEAAHPFTVRTAYARCDQASPMICEIMAPNPFEIELELQPPASIDDYEVVTHGISVSAERFTDGAWQAEATDRYTLDFRQCDAEFVREINLLVDGPQDLQSSFDQLFELTTENLNLPGNRLYPGPTRPFSPIGEETRDMPLTARAADLAARIDALASHYGTDEYLRANGNGTGGLNNAIGAAQRFINQGTECDRFRTRPLYAEIEAELEIVRRQIDEYTRDLAPVVLARESWVRRVEAQQRYISGQSEELGSGFDETANFVANHSEGTMRTVLSTQFLGVEGAALVNAPINIIGAAALHFQIYESIRAIDDLLDWRETIREATAFMEAEGYMRGMIHQYQLAEAQLERLLSVLRDEEREACTCLMSGDRL